FSHCTFHLTDFTMPAAAFVGGQSTAAKAKAVETLPLSLIAETILQSNQAGQPWTVLNIERFGRDNPGLGTDAKVYSEWWLPIPPSPNCSLHLLIDPTIWSNTVWSYTNRVRPE